MELGNMEPQFLSYELLEEITEGFSKELGEGGFGKVYKGIHKSREIAVKMLHGNLLLDSGVFETEFDNIKKLKHENIVQLIGYCHQAQGKARELNGKSIFPEEMYRALCFEYMEKGSLQKYLSDECDKMDWQTTYQIIKGSCEGLNYLHEGCNMFHLDLKPDNILLDKNMVPKLADFGLSKFVKDKNTMITKCPTGTLGYMPPEYIDDGAVSSKYDIFSLGVTIIKMVTGPKGNSQARDTKDFVEQAVAKWRSKLQETCSDSLLEEYCKQVKVCTEIALDCVNRHREKRPSIVDIITKLNETEVAIYKVRPDVVHEEALCFNPTEIRFPLQSNCWVQQRIRPLQLINKTENYVASKIIPAKNTLVTQTFVVVPPKSKFTVFLTPDQSRTTTDFMASDNFYVHSTKIIKGTDITDELFSGAAANSVGKAVIKSVYLHEEKPAFPIVQPSLNINFPVEFDDISLMTLQLHPTEPWFLCLCSENNGRSLQIYNYETKEWLFREVVRFDTVKFWGPKGVVASYGDGFIETYNFTQPNLLVQIFVGTRPPWTPVRMHSFRAHNHAIRSLATSPNGQYLLTSDVRGDIKLWNNDCVQQFEGHSYAVTEVKFNPDQHNIFASASEDCTVKIWNLSSTKPDAVLRGHGSKVTCVDFVKAKPWLISGSNDGTVKVWDYQAKICLKTLKDTCNVRAISSHPKIPIIFSALDDGTIRLWNSNTNSIENSIASYKGGVCTIDRNDALRVAIGCQGLIMMLETNSDED